MWSLTSAIHQSVLLWGPSLPWSCLPPSPPAEWEANLFTPFRNPRNEGSATADSARLKHGPPKWMALIWRLSMHGVGFMYRQVFTSFLHARLMSITALCHWTLDKTALLLIWLRRPSNVRYHGLVLGETYNLVSEHFLVLIISQTALPKWGLMNFLHHMWQ